MAAREQQPRNPRSGEPGLFLSAAKGALVKGTGKTQLHIYHGGGKGKTTAALGQALRAWGHGWRVLFVQFLKEEGADSGELRAARALGPRFRLVRGELPAPVLQDPGPGGRRALRAACVGLLERAVREASTRRTDLVVLDEAMVAVHLRLLPATLVLAAVRALSAAGVRLVVLTGHWAPPRLLRGADLVTEVRKVRHPFDRGRQATDGIDF